MSAVPTLVRRLTDRRSASSAERSGAPAAADDLSSALRAAAVGDVDAFLEFYDATVATVYNYEILRAGAAGAEGATRRAVADHAACRRYVAAWLRAAQHAEQSLPPLAWLLSLPSDDPTGRTNDQTGRTGESRTTRDGLLRRQEVGCA